MINVYELVPDTQANDVRA